MRIWTRPVSVEHLAAIHVDTAVAVVGIEFLEVGDDFSVSRITMAVLAPR